MDEEGSTIVWVALLSVLATLVIASAVRKGISAVVNSGMRDAEPGSVARKLSDAYHEFPQIPVVISGFRLLLLIIVSMTIALQLNVMGFGLLTLLSLSALIIVGAVASVDVLGSVVGSKWPKGLCSFGLKMFTPMLPAHLIYLS